MIASEEIFPLNNAPNLDCIKGGEILVDLLNVAEVSGDDRVHCVHTRVAEQESHLRLWTVPVPCFQHLPLVKPDERTDVYKI